MSYNVYINTKHVRGEVMEEKELQQLQQQIESIIRVKIDNDKEKTIEDEVKEILNMKGE